MGAGNVFRALLDYSMSEIADGAPQPSDRKSRAVEVIDRLVAGIQRAYGLVVSAYAVEKEIHLKPL
jgi:hypothetical protein